MEFGEFLGVICRVCQEFATLRPKKEEGKGKRGCISFSRSTLIIIIKRPTSSSLGRMLCSSFKNASTQISALKSPMALANPSGSSLKPFVNGPEIRISIGKRQSVLVYSVTARLDLPIRFR